MNIRSCFIALYLIVSASPISASVNSVVILINESVIVLPTTRVNVSLNGLVPSATYSVVCYINTSYPFQYILLGSQFNDSSSSISSYSLNGTDVTQGQLLVGQNLVIINGTFISPSNDYIVFTNLDQTNPFSVTNCFAIPIQVP